ncbi:MAG: hypothetical protein M3Y87_01950 [Myxococcota bacterium]|nr:hypothetical protein [Myxococcota bacterium]
MSDGRDGIQVDESAWPRVVLRWPAGIRSDREVAAALDTLRGIGRRGEEHTLLVDARGAQAPTSIQLGLILDLMRRVGPSARCLAIAVATRSACVRACVDSVRWMHLTPSRWSHFDEVAPAGEWLDECFASASRSALLGARAGERRSASTPPPVA